MAFRATVVRSLARSRIVQMHALKVVLRTGQQREKSPSEKAVGREKDREVLLQ